jgi:hypothetical protein
MRVGAAKSNSARTMDRLYDDPPRYNRGVMSDVTQILSRIETGDPAAAEDLWPLV